jgi:hypothetical protein
MDCALEESEYTKRGLQQDDRLSLARNQPRRHQVLNEQYSQYIISIVIQLRLTHQQKNNLQNDLTNTFHIAQKQYSCVGLSTDSKHQKLLSSAYKSSY